MFFKKEKKKKKYIWNNCQSILLVDIEIQVNNECKLNAMHPSLPVLSPF